MVPLGIWAGYADGHPTGIYPVFNPKAKAIILTRQVILLQKSYMDYNKVEKPILVTTSYEGSDDKEKLEMVPLINNNNSYNAVSDSKSNGDDEVDKNLFDDNVNKEVKVTSKTSININMVQAMKKLQALYHEDANKLSKKQPKIIVPTQIKIFE